MSCVLATMSLMRTCTEPPSMLDTVCITGSTLMPSSVMRLSSSNPFDDAFTISFVGIISCRSTFFITLMPFTVISPSVSVVSTSSESV